MKASVFSPEPCMICNVRACKNELPVCRKCISRFASLFEEKCRVCGKTCFSCECGNEADAKFLFFYQSRLSKKIIYAIKYNADRRLTDFICELMISKNNIKAGGFEAVAFVPRSKKGIKEAGYDQALMMAQSLSMLLNIPVIKAIKRVGKTEQKLLSAKERRESIKNQYEVSSEFKNCEKKPYKKILLVDDVCTTGATLNACASLLRKSVSKEVVLITAAAVCRKEK